MKISRDTKERLFIFCLFVVIGFGGPFLFRFLSN